MENHSIKIITYFSLIRVCLRLYGIYLIVFGLSEILSMIPFIFLQSDYGMPMLIAKVEELIGGGIKCLIGVVMFSITSWISLKITVRGKEISIKAEALTDIVQIIIKFIAVLLMVHLYTIVIVSLILFIVLGIFASPDVAILARGIFPLLLIVLCYLFYKNSLKVSKMIIK